MSSPALCQWIKDNAPSLVGILALAALSANLTWQSAELLRLTRSPIQQLPTQITSAAEQRTQAPTALLFGFPLLDGSAPAPITNLQMTLLGSFVHSDPRRSSAVIQRPGAAAQRYVVGMEIDHGARLEAVYPGRIELLRNGQRESLTFPSRFPDRYTAAQVGTEQSGSPPASDQSENLEHLQPRIQALRELLETP